MKKFKFKPETGFLDNSYFKNPISEYETRNQLQTPLNQLRDHINDNVLHKDGWESSKVFMTDENGSVILGKVDVENNVDLESLTNIEIENLLT